MRYPEPLHPPATIGVTAPSSGVAEDCQARLELVLDNLRTRGFKVVEGECLRVSDDSVLVSPARRAQELTEFLLRDDIDAVFPPWGGSFLIEILHLLDFERLAAGRPKWILGYSDTSTFTFAYTLLTDMATAHGPTLMELAPTQVDSLTQDVLGHLTLEPGGQFVQRSSETWQLKYEDFRVTPSAPFNLTEPTRWQSLNGCPELAFSGRLIGGCLDTLSRLVGTPYGKVPDFIERYREDGCILFLENCDLRPPEVVRALWSLRLAGWFEGLSGVLIGRSSGAESPHLSQLGALHQALDDLSVPVLIDIDCGHRPPQMLLVNGALAEVSYESGAGSVAQTLG